MGLTFIELRRFDDAIVAVKKALLYSSVVAKSQNRGANLEHSLCSLHDRVKTRDELALLRSGIHPGACGNGVSLIVCPG
jgi:hypothetical protein